MIHPDSINLILSDSRGIYIPRDFVTDDFNEIASEHCDAWGIKLEDRLILQNPDHDFYWDTWNEVCRYAKFIDSKGNVYTLHQDGDLWGICFERMTDEEKQNFGFEE